MEILVIKDKTILELCKEDRLAEDLKKLDNEGKILFSKGKVLSENDIKTIKEELYHKEVTFNQLKKGLETNHYFKLLEPIVCEKTHCEEHGRKEILIKKGETLSVKDIKQLDILEGHINIAKLEYSVAELNFLKDYEGLLKDMDGEGSNVSEFYVVTKKEIIGEQEEQKQQEEHEIKYKHAKDIIVEGQNNPEKFKNAKITARKKYAERKFSVILIIKVFEEDLLQKLIFKYFPNLLTNSDEETYKKMIIYFQKFREMLKSDEYNIFAVEAIVATGGVFWQYGERIFGENTESIFKKKFSESPNVISHVLYSTELLTKVITNEDFKRKYKVFLKPPQVLITASFFKDVSFLEGEYYNRLKEENKKNIASFDAFILKTHTEWSCKKYLNIITGSDTDAKEIARIFTTLLQHSEIKSPAYTILHHHEYIDGTGPHKATFKGIVSHNALISDFFMAGFSDFVDLVSGSTFHTHLQCLNKRNSGTISSLPSNKKMSCLHTFVFMLGQKHKYPSMFFEGLGNLFKEIFKKEVFKYQGMKAQLEDINIDNQPCTLKIKISNSVTGEFDREINIGINKEELDKLKFNFLDKTTDIKISIIASNKVTIYSTNVTKTVFKFEPDISHCPYCGLSWEENKEISIEDELNEKNFELKCSNPNETHVLHLKFNRLSSTGKWSLESDLKIETLGLSEYKTESS